MTQRRPYRPTRRALFAVGGGALLARPALAQTGAWPNRTVRVIAPFVPGGSADTLGRLVAQELTTTLGQSFVVENRAGAGGVVGSQQVARAAPDGYTFVISGIASHVVAPVVNPNAGFDPLRDFTHVAFLGGPPTILVVGAQLPVHNLAEFIALVRAGRPMSYGSPGAGTHGHLFGVAFARASGLPLEHVPYRGAGGAVADLIAGNLPAASITLASSLAGIRAGQLRALAVTTPRRTAVVPDVPTFAEQGFPDLVGITWFGLSGPAGLPEPIVTTLNREVVRIMAGPRMRERLAADSFESGDYSAPAFTRFVESEIARWAPVARAAGLSAE
ncbi:Bug family tripartite tricarboxylate transporter substrate binding protein [Falsiroseomonas oryzae]|uniref:Bug family tripartite tricarboxylate transporter substrate binding protein n=1 Tax=Falsiroseomonas oryzae TaxID=2766473 RepID=UPI0022EA3E0A|nr:tripartite tricarboxylate transporter substrate binding protein [Roseomonas sp. MO-31]